MPTLRTIAYILNGGLTLFALWAMQGHGGSWFVGVGVMAAVIVNVLVLARSGKEREE